MKFSIRDLLFITGIIAILITWWIDHWRLVLSAKELDEYAKKMIYEYAMENGDLKSQIERLTSQTATPDAPAPGIETPAPLFPAVPPSNQPWRSMDRPLPHSFDKHDVRIEKAVAS